MTTVALVVPSFSKWLKQFKTIMAVGVFEVCQQGAVQESIAVTYRGRCITVFRFVIPLIDTDMNS